MKIYSGSVCGLVVQVGCCEGILWECVWFCGAGMAL